MKKLICWLLDHEWKFPLADSEAGPVADLSRRICARCKSEYKFKAEDFE